MLVETYEVISNDPSQGDNALVNELDSPEALALIESLGLEGQRELLAESKDTGIVTRNPYREMTAAEFNLYMAMLPTRVRLEAYSGGPIPIRVLQVAAHARTFFPRIEVWSEPGSRDDPLLVGCDDEREYHVQKRHMLARWGDVLLATDELVVKAAAKLRAEWEKRVTDGIRERQSFLATLDVQIAAHLNGSWVNVPT